LKGVVKVQKPRKFNVSSRIYFGKVIRRGLRNDEKILEESRRDLRGGKKIAGDTGTEYQSKYGFKIQRAITRR